ncbi:MAG TPA: phage tail sheath subtilisin-like domain-containing protein [Candidatus Angelobacter sp.]|nr:phage tail sheath subtilisin-like domain-containing protein [Candidatus Angelobacter sp.]
MSVNVSYPGIYIQELPLSTHTITPAPTSITAFVGYTHPWKTLAFNTAVQLFSFTDYETNFGGLYTSGLVGSDVARSVYAFFLNGGNNAYVVGLQPEAKGTGPSVQFGNDTGDLAYIASLVPNSAIPNVGMLFQALEPADVVPMAATITNLRASTSASPVVYDTFDLIITYGTRIEVYRSVNLTIPQGQNKSLDKLINGVSQLVKVQPITGTSYGTAFPYTAPALPVPPAPASFALGTLPNTAGGLPAGFTTTYNASDFLPSFQQNSSLDNVEIFNILVVPGVADNVVMSAALSFAERKRAFAIADPPEQATAFPIIGSGLPDIDSLISSMPQSQNGALYFPYLNTTDPVSGLPMAVAPSGYVAGIYATTDSARGVWKAPAGIGTPLLGTTGPVSTGIMNDPQQGVLNLDSINCIRTFHATGTVVYGARTLVAGNPAFAQSKYVPVRRMTLFIEQTLLTNLTWVVFEPNDEPLWLAIKSSIEAFLLSLFNQQALQGSKPSEAFQVKCDSSTTTPQDQQNGIVNIVVGVALLKPAEFVIITISQLAGQTAGS